MAPWMLDSDWEGATFAGMLFPDNNRSKLITDGNQINHHVLQKYINISFNNIHDFIFTNGLTKS